MWVELCMELFVVLEEYIGMVSAVTSSEEISM